MKYFIPLLAFFLLSGCATKQQTEEAMSVVQVKIPERSLQGHMARLGQLMDNVFRFWEDDTFMEQHKDWLDEMIAIQYACKEIMPKMLLAQKDKLSDQKYDKIVESYKKYMQTSIDLTYAMEQEILKEDWVKAKEYFLKIDKNMRDSHGKFG